jgi:hypothetical protein
VLKPKVGDTVIIRGEILNIDDRWVTIISPPSTTPLTVSRSRISEVIEKPWVPEIGDMVYISSPDFNNELPYKLIGLHTQYYNTKWAIVEFPSDPPRVVPFANLRKSPICAG